MQTLKPRALAGFKAIALLLTSACLFSSAAPAVSVLPRMVTQSVDELKTIELFGNTRSEAAAGNDRGAVDDSLGLDHLQLLLKRSPQVEAALVHVIDELHDPSSPRFHHWLTTQQLGSEFGPAPSDLAAVVGWLSRHGFTINNVHANNMFVDFSGTAAQVRETFHTQIHHLDVDGVAHIANMSNPSIPAALDAVVAGVVFLHDFRPRSTAVARPQYTAGTEELVTPIDLTTIYNVKPLFSEGITGRGQTIVLIEDSDLYNPADWATFRSAFGLNLFIHGSLSQVHPAPASGANNCLDPGVTSNESTAAINSQWASAAAPDATIVVASCQSDTTTFGGFIALENTLSVSPPPPIISMTYTECEANNGATANAAFAMLYQHAVSIGTSVFVSTGNAGAAACDSGDPDATHGLGVNAYASTPYNVAVGGTDFGDTYAGTNAMYWSLYNGKAKGSALSYVPEITWNSSCASSMLASFNGFGVTYGTTGFCNNGGAVTTSAGGGGASRCAFGEPDYQGVVSGLCTGYQKPSWQVVFGNTSDHARDIPDVALFAGTNTWKHEYVYCDTSTGTPCLTNLKGYSSGGGTAYSTSVMAGFQALINQKVHSRQGNPNPRYYALAAAEYGSAGSTDCNASNGNEAAASCIFYDVTLGDTDIPCSINSYECYEPVFVPYGALSIVRGDFPAGLCVDGGLGLCKPASARSMSRIWPTVGRS